MKSNVKEFDEIPVIGELQPEEIADWLADIGDLETASQIRNEAKSIYMGTEGLFDFLWRKKPYLYRHCQIGFVPFKVKGSNSLESIPVMSISSLNPDEKLKGKSINIHLDRLNIFNYPGIGTNKKVMFVFKANNHIKEDKNKEAVVEPLVFSQMFEVREGSTAGIIGQPVFLGLRVGTLGVNFEFDIINVRSDGEQTILNVLESNTFKSGLGLLETAQPVIKPFADITMGVVNMLMEYYDNKKVQSVKLGLDFVPAAFAAPLVQGNYIIAQVPEQNSINWDDWVFNPIKGTLENNITGKSDLPYNYFVFRVSL